MEFTRLLGAANEFKEGDAALGLAAPDDAARSRARTLLANTTIGDVDAQPVHTDDIYAFANGAVDQEVQQQLAPWTFAQMKQTLLDSDEAAIRRIMPGLSSDAIACVVKLMSNAELVAVSRKIFNPLPGSQIGARGYLGARIQPNSPTDDPEDIRWQVFNGFAFAVGDVVLGTNPVSSEVSSVTAIELALKDIVDTFALAEVLPHCVLAHIDVQHAAEAAQPGSTALWFQSLAAVDDAARTFGISVETMRGYARQRSGRFGLYFETGQGADATNGHAMGFDMVMHESRNYGFARALAQDVERAVGRKPWVHLNDVAGFIGPEVFRTREQLVRCCLEDIAMGKLHGLCIGLDICSTLHMDVDLDDLDWCIEQIMPANPAYLMALPTRNDPMLSYLTTSYRDHVRIREQFGYRVNDAMWAFFQQLGVIDAHGQPTAHFGRPQWVYLQYRRARGDTRGDGDILREADEAISRVRARGVFIDTGDPALPSQIRSLYVDAKHCIQATLPPDFATSLGAVQLCTTSLDRNDYILHPPSGELLSATSIATLAALRERHGAAVQLVISDGLNALSLTDDGHLAPFLTALSTELKQRGFTVADQPIVVHNGRVRAGYRIGEELFGHRPAGTRSAILHVIGERPGSGHHAFSVYITAADATTWSTPGLADHNISRVVSGIADTALLPVLAAAEVAGILEPLMVG